MFTFDERKATQAMGRLLHLAGGRENYTKLLKILYIADRNSLRDIGVPVAGAEFCNMKAGPLASDVYDHIKGQGGDFWRSHIALDPMDRYSIMLRADPGDDELTDYEDALLSALWEKYRTYDYGQMISEVHKFEEWTDPGPSSVPLSPSAIMRGAGVPSETLGEAESRNARIAAVECLLRRHA